VKELTAVILTESTILYLFHHGKSWMYLSVVYFGINVSAMDRKLIL